VLCELITLTFVSMLGGCNLTQPPSGQSFTLVAVNGRPLPYIEFGGTDTQTGKVLRALRTDGDFTVFISGRFLWEGTIHYEFDGTEDPQFPPSRQRIVGPYSRLSDTSLTLEYTFIARFTRDHQRVFITDRTGAFNNATFEFARR
jgi:hypothetical protein